MNLRCLGMLMNKNIINDSKKSLLCVLVVVFIGYVGMALPYPIFAPLILKLKIINILNFDVSPIMYLGLLTASYPFGIFIGGFLIGFCADVFGRKKVLIITLLGTALSYFVTAYSFTNNLYLILILSRILTGVFESNMSIALSVASDLSGQIPKKNSFSYINAAMFMGYITGPLLGGYLSLMSFSLPLTCAGILALLSSLMIVVLFQDNYKYVKSQTASASFSFSNFKILYHNKIFIYIVLISLLTSLGIFNFYQFYPLYLVKIHSFNSTNIANITVGLNIGMLLSSLWIIHFISKFMSDKTTLSVSLFLFIVALLILINTGMSNYMLGIIFLLQGVCIPLIGINASLMISDNISKEHQGKINGLLSSFNGILSVILIIVISSLANFSIKFPFMIIILLFSTSILMVFLANKCTRTGSYNKR